jgi:toxin ParE1/3/4
MGAPTVVRSPSAQRDIRGIYLWIASDNGAERAEAIMARLNRASERLAKRPHLGRFRPDLAGDPHSFSVRPWTIVYRPLADGNGIIILRILDNRRNVAALLGKKT